MSFIEIAGTVTRTFYNGKGAEVIETFERKDGSEGKSRYALWFKEPHNLNEGDTGKWRGTFSVTVDEWEKEGETRHTAKVSLNGAKAIGDRAAKTAAPVTHPAPAGWDAPPAALVTSSQGFDFPADASTPF